MAEKYYNDGYKYTEIAKANNLDDVNQLISGQVLDIPKLETVASASPSEGPTVSPSETPAPTQVSQGNPTWGPVITANTYTVQEGDWLSKIADRAYGDPMAYQKLAQANNIANPDLIEPGMVLTIPR
ncbi:LysM peptidoglycan-binding domain-containing protein [Candidatus Daviesbacteria bacterium]|nr:LysM peptidoglycan-binding domain-containing protein [Candidatus Daviesbacteria bacterium]